MEYKKKLQTPQKALKLDKPKSTKSSKKKKKTKQALLSNVPIPINEMQCCEAKQSEIKEQKASNLHGFQSSTKKSANVRIQQQIPIKKKSCLLEFLRIPKKPTQENGRRSSW